MKHTYRILQGFHLNDVIFELISSTEMLWLYKVLVIYSLLGNGVAAASEPPMVLSGKKRHTKGKHIVVISSLPLWTPRHINGKRSPQRDSNPGLTQLCQVRSPPSQHQVCDLGVLVGEDNAGELGYQEVWFSHEHVGYWTQGEVKAVAASQRRVSSYTRPWMQTWLVWVKSRTG